MSPKCLQQRKIFIFGDRRLKVIHPASSLTCLFLFQHVTYRCRAYTGWSIQIFARLRRDDPIEPGDMKVYDRERLHIPEYEVPESPFPYCTIIDITYKVNVRILYDTEARKK